MNKFSSLLLVLVLVITTISVAVAHDFSLHHFEVTNLGDHMVVTFFEDEARTEPFVTQTYRFDCESAQFVSRETAFLRHDPFGSSAAELNYFAYEVLLLLDLNMDWAMVFPEVRPEGFFTSDNWQVNRAELRGFAFADHHCYRVYLPVMASRQLATEEDG